MSDENTTEKADALLPQERLQLAIQYVETCRDNLDFVYAFALKYDCEMTEATLSEAQGHFVKAMKMSDRAARQVIG